MHCVHECRMCLGEEGTLLSPCNCKGTLAFVHAECLQAWYSQKPHYEQHMAYKHFICDICYSRIDFECPPKQKRREVHLLTTITLYTINLLLYIAMFLIIGAFVVSPLLYIGNETFAKILIGEEQPDSTIITYFVNDTPHETCGLQNHTLLGSYRRRWHDLSNAPPEIGNQVLLARIRGFFMQRIRFWENLDKKYVLNDVFSSGMFTFVAWMTIMSQDLNIFTIGIIFVNLTFLDKRMWKMFLEFGSLASANYNYNTDTGGGWISYIFLYIFVLLLVPTDTLFMRKGYKRDNIYELVDCTYKYLKFIFLIEPLHEVHDTTLRFKNKHVNIL